MRTFFSLFSSLFYLLINRSYRKRDFTSPVLTSIRMLKNIFHESKIPNHVTGQIRVSGDIKPIRTNPISPKRSFHSPGDNDMLFPIILCKNHFGCHSHDIIQYLIQRLVLKYSRIAQTSQLSIIHLKMAAKTALQ